jgi:3-dehydrosphinganine reductase
MVKQKRPGRLALVSSTVGYMSFLGWASYAPGKQALRGSWAFPLPVGPTDGIMAGLADTLQSELMLYPGISVHIYFPGSILTPGFEEEQKSKPQITKEIDGARPKFVSTHHSGL